MNYPFKAPYKPPSKPVYKPTKAPYKPPPPKPTYKPTQAAYTQPMNQYQNSHNHHDSYDSASNYGQNNNGYQNKNAYHAPCFERAVGISCWTCRGQNMDECARNGYEQKCYAAQSACMVEVRKNDGDVVGVHMGCKAPDACWRNKSYNFGRNAQCHPGTNKKLI